MNTLITRIDKAWYPHFDRNWDDQLFRDTLLQYLCDDSVILDLGAGAGIVEQMNFKGLVKRVCGVDLDPRVLNNPMLDEGRIANANSIPYDSAYFDVVFADNVVEHLPDPVTVFCEIQRVLKPGGVFIFKTPNKWHYMPTIARITPYSFHQWVNRKRGRAEIDTFPTQYLANTMVTVKRHATTAGLLVEKIKLIEGRPEYLRFMWLTYIIGIIYERTVNFFHFLAPFRILLVGILRKP